MQNGEINQISIGVTDFQAAKKFFELVFQWTVDIEKYPNYAIVDWDNPMSLGFYKTENIITGGPMLVFSVNDIDTTITKVQEAGGEILQNKHPMSDNEFGCVFKDIFGNRYRLKGPSHL